MIFLIHSDASFLVEWDAKSNYGGYFYLGWNQHEDEPQKINGAVDVSASLLPLVEISVAEAELGGKIYNAKRGSFYASPWKKWVGCKSQPQFLWIIIQRAGFATAQ